MRKCAVPNCTESMIPGKMLCIPHWLMVPPKLQQLIYSARSALKKSRKPESRAACQRRYQTLRAEAIQYVIENQGKEKT